MRVLVLWADDKSGNLGVRALAQGTRAVVESVFPGAHIDFQDYAPGSAPTKIGAANLGKAVVGVERSLGRWMAGYDIVIDTGSGDSFADIYGLRRLAEMAAMRNLAVRHSGRVLMGPQTIGPFATRAGKAIARLSLRGVDEILARDTISQRCAAEELGRWSTLTTDVVFAISAPEETVGPVDVSFNVSGLLWNPNPHVDSDLYRRWSVETLERLVDAGHSVRIVAHVLGGDSNDSDTVVATELGERFSETVQVVLPTSLENVRANLAAGKVTIGARMHACLNSLSVGVPAIAWAYSRKFEPLLEGLGWTAITDLRDGHSPVEATLSYVRSAISGELVSAVTDARNEAHRRLDQYRVALTGDRTGA